MVPYYAVAIVAVREAPEGSGPLHLGFQVMVVHPEREEDSPETLAIEASKVELFSEGQGWRDHQAIAARIDYSISAIMTVEKDAPPFELRVAKILAEAP